MCTEAESNKCIKLIIGIFQYDEFASAFIIIIRLNKNWK